MENFLSQLFRRFQYFFGDDIDCRVFSNENIIGVRFITDGAIGGQAPRGCGPDQKEYGSVVVLKTKAMEIGVRTYIFGPDSSLTFKMAPRLSSVSANLT